jgi:hypothetical protein
MTEIMRTIAGSRLYGTNNADSDTDYKAVHLPSARDILLRPKRKMVRSTSSGGAKTNGSEDVDMESFELQRYLKLASDMQTIPVELLFAPTLTKSVMWQHVVDNKYSILNRNTDAFVGYCKGQAVRYSMRGTRLNTYMEVVAVLAQYEGTGAKVQTLKKELLQVEGVKVIPKEEGNGPVDYLDVYGRQTPMTVRIREALKIYQKPIDEAGKRANNAQQANGADWKALYHAVRIAEQGVTLFKTGEISFPSQNAPLLMRIRNGEMDMNEVLDYFDEQAAELQMIGADSPLPEKPDYEWIDAFVCQAHAKIVRTSGWGA